MAKKKFEKAGRAGSRLRTHNKDGTWCKKRSDADGWARFRSQDHRFSIA